jgi:WD40 repeat protein
MSGDLESPEGEYLESFGLAFTPDGKYLFSVSWRVQIWDVETKKLVSILPCHDDHVFSLALSPDGKILATGSADKTIGLWDVSLLLDPSREDVVSRMEKETGLVLDGVKFRSAITNHLTWHRD